jgi:hypothetical protein
MQLCSVLPGVKASSLLSIPIVGGDPYLALETALRTHVVGFLGGDPDRDIDALTTFQDPTGCLYVGTWQGHRASTWASRSTRTMLPTLCSS